MSGLSPQVRGTDRHVWPDRRFRRFIPAGAGNRTAGRGRSRRRAVYPRRCGEQTKLSRSKLMNRGLSPQVRGTDRFRLRTHTSSRFIPAGAGNRLYPACSKKNSSVYPRRCGEQNDPILPTACPNGLSPQVRGTGFGPPIVGIGSRFIPAGAGNRQNWP